jgi:hypothetical protein
MPYCGYSPCSYVIKFFENSDHSEAEILQSQWFTSRAETSIRSTAFYALRSAVLAGGFVLHESAPSSETSKIVFVEPPALLNPQGIGIWSYGILVPAITMLKLDARFVPAHILEEQQLDLWVNYRRDLAGMVLPFDSWKPRFSDSQWIVEVDNSSNGHHCIYQYEPIESNAYGLGIVVRTHSEASIIMQDILWLYDSGLRDPDIYAFVIPLDAINDGKNIQPSEIIMTAPEDFSVDISAFFHTPYTSYIVEDLIALIHQTLIETHSFCSLLDNSLITSIPHLSFPDNRTTLCRALVAQDAIQYTTSGKYLFPLEDYTELCVSVKYSALNLLLSKIKTRWRGRCVVEFVAEEDLSLIIIG